MAKKVNVKSFTQKKENKPDLMKVLELYVFNNYNAMQTSKQTGISRPTILKWWNANKDNPEFRANAKSNIVKLIDQAKFSKTDLIDYSFEATKKVIELAVIKAHKTQDLDKLTNLIVALNNIGNSTLNSIGALDSRTQLSANEIIYNIINVKEPK